MHPGRRLPEAKLDFNRDIRPILSDNCFACHGLDAKKRKADLRLDVPEGAYRKTDEGTQAVKPRDVNGSELWKRIITTDEDDLMPPPESHKKLTDAQKATLKRWIEEGAEYKPHWSFINRRAAARSRDLKSQISNLKSDRRLHPRPARSAKGSRRSRRRTGKRSSAA